MACRQLKLGTRSVQLHKASVSPDFASKTVLVGNAWDYVSMWLKRQGQRTTQELFYWDQARQFFEATKSLPNTSAPLTSYYCFLNAVKTLLVIRRVDFSEHHGVSGQASRKKTSLANEVVEFKSSGVLAALCKYLGEPAAGQYPLRDILYNLPYIHRAYTLTFSSRPDLFIPISKPRFVIKNGTTKSWFSTEVTDRHYANQHTVNKLPSGFERDAALNGSFVVRRKRRFDWKTGQNSANLDRLRTYHRRTRRHTYYIHAPTPLWYLKRNSNGAGMIDRSSLTLTFAAMHRLSELARYEPMRLARHFDSQHNWLLSEFIATARDQFLDELASEITGRVLLTRGVRPETKR